MAVSKIFILALSSFLIGCESAFVDSLPKCDINDGDCQKDVVQTVLRDIGKTGIPDVQVPPIDPIKLYNITVSVLDIIDLTLVEGEAKGVKDCIVEKFTTSIEDEHASMQLLCDIYIKGHYKVFSKSPLIKNFLGGETIHGDGTGKVKIDKLRIIFDYYFDIVERNGDTYIHCKFDKTIYKYDIGGKVMFDADNLYLGKEEQSRNIVQIMNNNWKPIMAAAGSNFMDTAMEYVYRFTHNFFDNVATKYYLINDMRQYVKKSE